MDLAPRIINAVNELAGIEAPFISENGFPMYDLMINSHKGYIASSVIFYTEDVEKNIRLKDLKTQNDIDDLKDFLIKNSQYLSLFTELENKNIKAMSLYAHTAFNNLCSKDRLNNAYKKTLYGNPQLGIAHLITDKYVLIFNHEEASIYQFIEGKDLREAPHYNKLQDYLSKAYLMEEIKPKTRIKGKARDRIMQSMIADEFNHLNDYQKEIYLLLKDFTTVSSNNIQIKLDAKNDTKNAFFNYDDALINIQLPNEKNKDFILTGNNPDTTFSNKSISEVLYFLSKKITEYEKNKRINSKNSGSQKTQGST